MQRREFLAATACATMVAPKMPPRNLINIRVTMRGEAGWREVVGWSFDPGRGQTLVSHLLEARAWVLRRRAWLLRGYKDIDPETVNPRDIEFHLSAGSAA